MSWDEAARQRFLDWHRKQARKCPSGGGKSWVLDNSMGAWPVTSFQDGKANVDLSLFFLFVVTFCRDCGLQQTYAAKRWIE